MGDAVAEDGRMRFRYNFRRKSASPSPTPKKTASPGVPVTDSVKREHSHSPFPAQIPRRHPPSARISAVRNYPAGCGSNAAANKRKAEEEPEEVKDDGMRRIGEAEPEEVKDDGMLDARRRIGEALLRFETVYNKMAKSSPRPDMQALKMFKEDNRVLMDRRHVGGVPGVEVGDRFDMRVEMCVVGVHRQHRMPVDYIHQDGKLVALSLVFMRTCNEGDAGWDVFDYCSPGDLTNHGNLALKNNIDTRTPVRVIHGLEGYRNQFTGTRVKNKKRRMPAYVYGGLFSVEKYRRKKGSDGVYVCVFQFKRMPGQAELDMKAIKILKLIDDVDYDKHLIVKDISQGAEKIPIPVVNPINDEHPMPFKYTKVVMYPPQLNPPLPRGCDCIDGCSDSESCACAVKNGGELPFNEDGDIVEAKPLVYECGPSCKCPPSCHNRVAQNGIKFRLEVFKTELRGWGVRSREPIPMGSFICEYAGVLLDDKVADKNANDEYLFDIGDNLYDESLWDGLKTSIPDLKRDAPRDDDDVGFAIDALEYGNVGRFINHSCTPNVYAQNLLFDHDNKKMPHVALFAQDDIKPMEELTYDYNYGVERFRDSEGNLKRKNCYCGSIECTGRMY